MANQHGMDEAYREPMPIAMSRAQVEASASAFSTSPLQTHTNLAPVATEASTTVGNSSLTELGFIMHNVMSASQMPAISAFQPSSSLPDSLVMRQYGDSGQTSRDSSPKPRRRPTGPAFDPHAVMSAEELAKHQDRNTKPPISFLTLCIYGINQAPLRETGELDKDGLPSKAKMLSLSEVYSWIMANFPYYKYASNAGTWKNSVRHNLSLSPGFKKVQRSADDPGKGQYWMIELNPPEGDYTPRRNRRKQSKVARHNSLSPYSHGLRGTVPSPGSQSGSELEPRGRSRSLTHGQTSRDTSPVLSPIAFSTSSLNMMDQRSSGEISVADLGDIPMSNNFPNTDINNYLPLPPDGRYVSRSVGNLREPHLYQFHPTEHVTNQLKGYQCETALHLRPHVDRMRSHSDPLNLAAGQRAGLSQVMAGLPDLGGQHRRTTVPSQNPQLHGQPHQHMGVDNTVQDRVLMDNFANFQVSTAQPILNHFPQGLNQMYATHPAPRDDVFPQDASQWRTPVFSTGSLPVRPLGEPSPVPSSSGHSDGLAGAVDQASAAGFQGQHQPQPTYNATSPMTMSLKNRYTTVPTVSVTDDSTTERDPSGLYSAEHVIDMATAAAVGATEPALPPYQAIGQQGQQQPESETAIHLQLMRQQEQQRLMQNHLGQQQVSYQPAPPVETQLSHPGGGGGGGTADMPMFTTDLPSIPSSDASGISAIDDLTGADMSGLLPGDLPLPDLANTLNDLESQLILNSCSAPGAMHHHLDGQVPALHHDPVLPWPNQQQRQQ